jgi:hypothetical protein
MTDAPAQLRKRILDLAAQYFLESSPAGDFIPGVSSVPVAGKVIDGADISAVVDLQPADSRKPSNGIWHGLSASVPHRWLTRAHRPILLLSAL